MPDQRVEIVDAHFHIWDLAKQNLPWLAKTNGQITRTYTLRDYAQRYVPFDVRFTGGVYVEVDAADALAEDRLMAERRTPLVMALVLRCTLSPYMRVPLMASGVREPLHIDAARPGRCLEPSFIAGLRLIAAHGLSFDACSRVDELDDLYRALVQVPEATVVIDHLGNVTTYPDEKYQRAMRNLARLPNVYCKISGYPTADRNFVRTILDFATATFPAERLMYASNFPVVSLYSTFEEHLHILLDYFAADERIFSTNARRAYRIADHFAAGPGISVTPDPVAPRNRVAD